MIANRGEIALRVLRACRELGIETVAVYSQADADALHVQLAGQAVCIGPARAADSYLNQDALLTVAKATGCDGVHPGYGFLSENADFADACAAAGLTFIGPSGDAIRKAGSKSAARDLMRAAGVPVTPGCTMVPLIALAASFTFVFLFSLAVVSVVNVERVLYCSFAFAAESSGWLSLTSAWITAS